MKIILLSKDNNLLLDSTDDKWKLLINNTVEMVEGNDTMVIKLKNDYDVWVFKIEVIVKDWEIMYSDKNL